MKISDLIIEMKLPVLFRHISSDRISSHPVVLMGEEYPCGEDVILILPASRGILSPDGEDRVLFMFSGAPADTADPDEKRSAVWFDASPSEIAVAVQHALYEIIRKEENKAGEETLLGKLIEGKIEGDEKASEIKRCLGIPSEGRFCLCLVSYLRKAEEVAYEKAVAQLSAILHGALTVAYKGDLVALIPSEKAVTGGSGICGTELDAWLRQQNACAVVSNSALRPVAAAALYYQVSTAMRFALSGLRDDTTRVFSYNVFAAYHCVELCIERYREEIKVSSPVYLCHPALGNVLRYDRENNTDFARILRKYLENNCNTSQTARELYMHRNTMISKLEILKELLGVPLSEFSVREQLLFSFRVLDYSEKYLRNTMFRL